MSFNRLCHRALLAGAAIGGITAAVASSITGPSSSESPYNGPNFLQSMYRRPAARSSWEGLPISLKQPTLGCIETA